MDGGFWPRSAGGFRLLRVPLSVGVWLLLHLNQ